ncbi:tetratricopeptide repeat protein [Ilumatobacter sp.]|uniref:tetratricopeptide repeat protein n=1 Tax=Ilumatobacter sp. TaxID=1967498 RepID=UPI003B52651B
MTRSRRLVLGLALALVLGLVAAFGVPRLSDDPVVETAADAQVITPGAVSAVGGPPADTLEGLVEQLRTRLEVVPGDHVAWATLGLAYVQQARVVADPSLYPNAEGALQRSLEESPDDNFLAHAGLSALAAGRHEFVEARRQARLGLEINDFSAILWGALSDAQLQLGEYDAATRSVDRMLELAPAQTSSLSRASYLAELRGDRVLARSLMEQAFDAAGTPTDRAFALTVLGDLRFGSGDPGGALELYNQARDLAPSDATALAGKARAEAALGQIETALDHYRELVEQTPDPSHVVAYAELLESLGRIEEAEEQYAVVDAIQTLFEANGVEPDAAPVLFLADHGEPERALAAAEEAVADRPFLAMHDAHAWALHAVGRHDEALAASQRALELGTPDASFLYHSGRIRIALGDLDGGRADLERALEINPFFDPLDAPAAQAALAGLGAP